MLIETKNWHIVSGNAQFFELIMQDGKREVKKYVRKLTNPQMNYIYWLFGAIAKDFDVSQEYIKHEMKGRFLMSYEFKNPYPRSIASLSTVETIEFIENILNFMASPLLDKRYPNPEDWKKWIRFIE